MGLFGSPKRDRPKRRVTSKRRHPAQTAPEQASAETEFENAVINLNLMMQCHAGILPSQSASWSVDQGEGRIVFASSEQNIEASAPVQIIGTTNTEDGTWLWGWANDSIRQPLSKLSRKLYDYGSGKGYEQMQRIKFKCDSDMAWGLAALACQIGDQQGAYRGPAGSTFVWMTYGSLTIKKIESERPVTRDILK